jgi:hypothetical protein
MQGTVMGAAQMLTQGFKNCNNFQDRDSAPGKRHGRAKNFSGCIATCLQSVGQKKHHQDFQARLCGKATEQD